MRRNVDLLEQMLLAAPYHLEMQRKRAQQREWKTFRGHERGHQDAMGVQLRLGYQEGWNVLVVKKFEQSFRSRLGGIRHTDEIPH